MFGFPKRIIFLMAIVISSWIVSGLVTKVSGPDYPINKPIEQNVEKANIEPEVGKKVENTKSIEVSSNSQSIVLAGGCFWGIQEIFLHAKGVIKATAGYAGGNAQTAKYDLVSSGETKHAEAVEVIYNPDQISLEQILQIFFLIAHNPTELNRQGPDIGHQYRSEIFYSTPQQKEIATQYIANLGKSKLPAPIATIVEPLNKFYPAEDYHQNYVRNHPNETYVIVNDLPKLSLFKAVFPDLYVE